MSIYPNVQLFPERFIQGDLLDLGIVLPDYPASDYTLSWALVTPTGQVQIVAQEVGDDYQLYVPSVFTAAFPYGEYDWQAYVTDIAGNRTTVGEGFIYIRPDFDQLGAGFDASTHVKKVLDAIEAVLEQRATKDQEGYTIEGRQLSRTKIGDLLKLRELYRKLWLAELKDLGVLQGKVYKNIVRVRFA